MLIRRIVVEMIAIGIVIHMLHTLIESILESMKKSLLRQSRCFPLIVIVDKLRMQRVDIMRQILAIQTMLNVVDKQWLILKLIPVVISYKLEPILESMMKSLLQQYAMISMEMLVAVIVTENSSIQQCFQQLHCARKLLTIELVPIQVSKMKNLHQQSLFLAHMAGTELPTTRMESMLMGPLQQLNALARSIAESESLGRHLARYIDISLGCIIIIKATEESKWKNLLQQCDKMVKPILVFKIKNQLPLAAESESTDELPKLGVVSIVPEKHVKMVVAKILDPAIIAEHLKTIAIAKSKLVVTVRIVVTADTAVSRPGELKRTAEMVTDMSDRMVQSMHKLMLAVDKLVGKCHNLVLLNFESKPFCFALDFCL
jgi:hypothetical protein